MLKLLALIAPLSLDSFALSAAVGLTSIPTGRRLRISFLFAGLEAGMPIVGLIVGRPLGAGLGMVAEYVAGAAIILLGALVLVHGQEDEERRLEELRRADGWLLIGLGLIVSLDEFGIGLAIGLLRLPVVPALALIAAQAFLWSQLGLWLGARLGAAHERAERLSGLALMFVGVGLVANQALGG